MSVAIRRGKHCKIEAISGQDVFDKRSNTVRLLGRLATAVVATGEAVWYTGDTRDLAPQVEDAVQEYVDEAHSKTIAILPLQRPTPQDDDDPRKRVEPEPPIGALIVELIEDNRVSPNAGPAGRRRPPAQLDGDGQRHGAPEPVPDAGVAGLRQDQDHLSGPHAAEDRRRRGRCAAADVGSLPLARATDDGVERRFGAGPAAGRVRGNRRQGGRPEGRPRRSRHQGPTPIETRRQQRLRGPTRSGRRRASGRPQAIERGEPGDDQSEAFRRGAQPPGRRTGRAATESGGPERRAGRLAAKGGGTGNPQPDRRRSRHLRPLRTG